MSVLDSNGRPLQADLRALLAQRRQALARQITTFGTGSLDRVYRIGPHRELLGRSVSSLSRAAEHERERATSADASC